MPDKTPMQGDMDDGDSGKGMLVLLGFGAAIVVPLLVAFTLGQWLTTVEWRRDVIRHGAAHWVFDDETGKATFEWVNCDAAEQRKGGSDEYSR